MVVFVLSDDSYNNNMSHDDVSLISIIFLFFLFWGQTAAALKGEGIPSGNDLILNIFYYCD